MPNLVAKAFDILKNEGLDIVFYKIIKKFDRKDIYQMWISRNERNQMKTETLNYNPKFSVVIPVYNVADDMLRACIDSVLKQTYRNFEIVLVDDASTQESVRTVLAEYDKSISGGKKAAGIEDVEITVIYRKDNGHISRATNDGIEAAKGEFVALCDCDDLYAPNALYEVAKKLNENPEYDFIYSDEDKVEEDGTGRRDAFFKPDWSPETFMSYMYTCHLAIYRKCLLDELGGLREGFEGSQDYDLVLRLMEKTDKIGHIPKVLYHWRMRKESTANALTAKPYILEATRKAKEEALARRGLTGTLKLIPEIGQYRVVYHPMGEPMISIVIPSKDNVEVLKRCITSIFEMTDYERFEIILVDNGSNEENKEEIEKFLAQIRKHRGEHRIQYIYEKMEFNFSKMCNMGAAVASGELLLFLNDDIEISRIVEENSNIMAEAKEWLSILAGQAQVPYTGAVGAKLYYPGGFVFQHAGVLNLRIGPGHCLYGLEDNTNYYYGRNLLDYNFSVVTGACLMVAAEKFKEVGGFDEELLVAYNDVDLCFRLVKAGYHNVLRNDVALIHHESVSRGLDEASAAKEARRKREMEKLYEKNPEFINGYDPCYNPNLVPDKGDFTLDVSKAYLVEKPLQICDATLLESEGKQDDIALKIESVLEDEDSLRINGFAYITAKQNNNHNDVRVVLISKDNKVYVFPVHKQYRKDIVRTNGSRKGLALAGFECVIAKECLVDGTYTIGVLMEKTCVKSESTFTKEVDRCVSNKNDVCSGDKEGRNG